MDCTLLELGLKRLHFPVFFGNGQLDGIAFVLFGEGQSLVQLLFKFTIPHLFEDVGIPGLIHLEGGIAVRANDVVHV